ncbi:ABC transporter permease [Lachnospiraceae bacterium ZAX-1]
MNFIAEMLHNRKLIWKLSKNDFKTKFAGSYLGRIWAFVQPVVTVFVYWFVFEKGLHQKGVNTKEAIEVAFVLWLVAGLTPWFFFSDCLSAGTSVLLEYNYLVKKVVFNIRILPIVKIVSALFVHMAFVAFVLLLFCFYGYLPDLYTLQVLYYSICIACFVLGLVYITSAVVVFFRDLSQIVMIFLQIGVWITPIMWNIDTMGLSPALLSILRLNPLFYIVAGYRDALINKIWFWEHPGMSVYFWGVTIAIILLGNIIFQRLKVHFADVI